MSAVATSSDRPVSAGVVPAADQPEIILSEEDIRRLLPMYRDDAVFMRSAVLRDGKLLATFDTFPHPFSLRQPKHLTREHALAYISQAAYVLTSLLGSVHADWPLGRDEFRRLAVREQAVFSCVHMAFDRLIQNRDGIEMEMRCERFRSFRARIYGRLAFVIQGGCRGYCDAVIAPDMTLIPDA